MSDVCVESLTTNEEERDVRRRNRATIESYLGLSGDQRRERYLLFTEDGSGGLRTTDAGEPIRAVGHEELRQADEANSVFFRDWKWWDVQIFETQDPNRFWAECDGGGTVCFPAYPEAYYENHYIHSFEMHDGRIRTYWEYMNPCAENVLSWT